jgi:putative FmdB family regulatory protein
MRALDVFRPREDFMPLYAYQCQSCNSDFELLVRSSDVPVCPSCGGKDLAQQIARISTEIKYPGVAKSWRAAASRSGDISNFSKKEIATKKS